MKQLSGVNIQYMCMNGIQADTVLQCFLLFPCISLLFSPFVSNWIAPSVFSYCVCLCQGMGLCVHVYV